ncbi:hypothetical protein KGF57_000342 [Candida theae]|uniref:Uncharacterized protein n=1 Tax=Candida theae TaxID=1198502 RepID=A0AAD5BJ46_9ASCO|nr:uncharacterized protein KGF57_000342 [Candida theae]KAI5967502.1 hypothetical protein KGF57_000342 [Candida theae]
MTQSPILSYKKPSKDQAATATATAASTSSATLTPRTSFSPSVSATPSNTSSPQLPPHTSQPRKVSSRRKALQEFYHLQQQQSESNQEQNDKDKSDKDNVLNTDTKPTKSEVEPSDLKTAEDVEKFIKTSSTKDILKLRNKIQSQLSSSSQKKKEIIYDNYYELIKLSNMLGDLSESNKSIANIATQQDLQKIDSLSGFKIFNQPSSNDAEGSSQVSVDAYLDEVLNDLSNFNQTTIKKFTTGGFNKVLNRLNRYADRAESNASVAGIYNESTNGGGNVRDDVVDKQDVINEIGYILNLPNRQLQEHERANAESKIDKILQSTKSEALKLQLNTIKSRMY